MDTEVKAPRGVAELLDALINKMAEKSTKSSLEGIANVFIAIRTWTIEELYNSFCAIQIYKIQIHPESDSDLQKRLIVTSIEDSILESARKLTSGFTFEFGVSDREEWVRAYGPGGAEFISGNIMPGIRRGFGGQPLVLGNPNTPGTPLSSRAQSNPTPLVQGVTNAQMEAAITQLQNVFTGYLNEIEVQLTNVQSAIKNINTPVSQSTPFVVGKLTRIRNILNGWVMIGFVFLIAILVTYQTFRTPPSSKAEARLDSLLQDISAKQNRYYERDFMREPSPFSVLDSNLRTVARKAGIPDSILIDM